MLDIIRIIFILSKWRIWSLIAKPYISKPIYFLLSILEFVTPSGELDIHHCELMESAEQSLEAPRADKKTSFPRNGDYKLAGKALVRALQELGPIYIKFGQTLSSRPDLIGEQIAQDLFILQDKLSPFPSYIAVSTIEKELGKSVDQIFDDFTPEPVAAASIAQVHKAILQNGDIVAVKILRPNIEEEYRKNIEALYSLSSIAKHLVPEQYKRFKAKELIDLFDDYMKMELNLLMEASCCDEMKYNCAGDEIVIPNVYWELSSKRVLTTSWIDGISIYDTKKIIELGLDGKELSKKLAITFFNQAYRDGFFHADLHPGNVLITKEGKIALVDFGIVGRLSDKDRFAIAEIFHAIFRKDYVEVAKIHIRVSYIPEDTNIFLFAQYCRAFCEPIANLPLKDISMGLLLEKLLKMTSEFNMHPQHQLFLLQKTMIVLEGIGKSLYPDINMWRLSEPWIKKWAAKNISPEAQFLRVAKKLFNNLINMV